MNKIAVIAVAAVCIGRISADTHVAAGCSQADVQAAVNAATDGDTVTVPGGNCTWNAAVAITNKRITVTGAGTDQTMITQGSGNVLFAMTGVDGKPFRVHQFTLNFTTGPYTGTSFWGAMTVAGTCKNWRIDHCKFIQPLNGNNLNAIHVSGFTYGLIDHCTFDGDPEILISGDGDAAWQRSLSLGSADAVYIEDCVFQNAPAPAVTENDVVDAVNGGRYVFRYNTVQNGAITCHSGCPSGLRGTFSYEIYNNTQGTTGSIYRIMLLRSGTGVIFNNTITGSYSSGYIQVDDERSCNGNGVTCHTRWNTCNGSSMYDGNTAGGTGYPCRDQIGRSTDAGITAPQSSEPLYVWNNTVNGSALSIIINPGLCTASANHIQKDRDYFYAARPGYAPYTYPHPLVSGGSTAADLSGVSGLSGPAVDVAVISSSGIGFHLARETDIRINIFDFAGRKVCTLLNSRLDAGSHAVPIGSGGWPSGVYLIRCIAGENMLLQKSLIIP